MSAPIHQEVVFAVSPARVYEALVSSTEHAAFTGAPADISREAGGAFSCHGGQIVGRNIELVPNERIVQAWRVANWEPGLFTLVRFTLRAEGNGTRLVLDHTAVPADKAAPISDGWQARYWGPMQKYFTK